MSVCKINLSEHASDRVSGASGAREFIHYTEVQVFSHKRLLIEVKKWNVRTPLNKTDYSNYFKVCKLLILFRE